MAGTAQLHGSDDFVNEEASKYKSPKEFSGQGGTRVIRDLEFSYLVATKGPSGEDILVARTAPRDAEVTAEQIGLISLKKGEANHSFYTSDELDNIAKIGRPAPAPDAETDVSSLGEVELAEWIANGKDGGAFTMDEVLDVVGDDKDLANRMLAAEILASDGDPRKGLEAGLTSIIER